MSSSRTVLLVTVCALVSQPGSAGSSEPVNSSLIEQSRVRLVRLPVVFEERAPGACEDIDPSRIQVLEDGASVEITHVESTQLDGIHAILLDSSRPMLGALQKSKSAARRYIESLPPNELALLASFDDSLILHSPLTTNRERLEEDLIWIETGLGSNLWDATRQIIRYLRPRSERKLLVLLTDGCDTQTDREIRPEEVIDLAVRTSSLVVVPLVIEPPMRCEDSRNTLESLTAIAKETGGLLHKLESASELDSILATLRKRLESERYVTYRPIPFGSGPKDQPDRQSHRWRKLEVKLSGKKKCRASPSGPARRLESAARGAFSGDEDEPVGSIVRPFELDENRWLAGAAIRDVVKDSGLLYAPSAGTADRYLVSPAKTRAEREITAIVPPLERVMRSNSRPVDVVIDALGLAGSIPGYEDEIVGEAGWAGAPFLVNGRSLLDLRGSLARAMFDRPDYRQWAYAKIRAERLAVLDELVARGGSAIDPSRVAALRKILAGESWTPEPHELERYLGAWLGDVPAVELYTGVERRFGEALMGMSDRPSAAAFAADVEALWKNLAVWLPRPREVRLLGILVPAYDPFRDVVGFYRAVLPRPQSFLGTWEYSADTPLGFRLLSWILEQESLARIVRESFSVQDVSYRKLAGRNFGELLRRETLDELKRKFDWQVGRLVSIALARRDLRGVQTVVRAYYSIERPGGRMPAPEHFCILLPARPPVDEVEGRFFEALIETKSRAPVPCVLKYGGEG